MYRVIDTIRLRGSWIRLYPELAERGEGLMLILDPSQISERPSLEGREVTVVKPDGGAASLTVTSCEARHGVVGLFFGGIRDAEIPVGSSVEW